MKIDFFFRNTAKSDDTSSSKDVREFLFPLFFSFLLETREKWERTGIRKRILGCLKSKANSLDHGASDGTVLFDSTASLNSRPAFSTATGTSTDHFSHFARV